jgi:hypothetical protein
LGLNNPLLIGTTSISHKRIGGRYFSLLQLLLLVSSWELNGMNMPSLWEMPREDMPEMRNWPRKDVLGKIYIVYDLRIQLVMQKNIDELGKTILLANYGMQNLYY